MLKGRFLGHLPTPPRGSFKLILGIFDKHPGDFNDTGLRSTKGVLTIDLIIIIIKTVTVR